MLTYLLTEEYLVDSIYGSSVNNTHRLKFILEGLQCYKDTQMKAYVITKLITEVTGKRQIYSTEIKCSVLLLVFVS